MRYSIMVMIVAGILAGALSGICAPSALPGRNVLSPQLCIDDAIMITGGTFQKTVVTDESADRNNVMLIFEIAKRLTDSDPPTDVDTLFICGNHYWPVFEFAVEEFVSGRVTGAVIITGGKGRATPLLIAAVRRQPGFGEPFAQACENRSEAWIIAQIMTKLIQDRFPESLAAFNRQVLLEEQSTNTKENFLFARQKFPAAMRGRIAVAHEPLEEIRAIATARRQFSEAIEKGEIRLVRRTVAYDSSPDDLSTIALCLWRIIVYSAKGDLAPQRSDNSFAGIDETAWDDFFDLLVEMPIRERSRLRIEFQAIAAAAGFESAGQLKNALETGGFDGFNKLVEWGGAEHPGQDMDSGAKARLLISRIQQAI